MLFTLKYWTGDGDKLWKMIRVEAGKNVDAFVHLLESRESLSTDGTASVTFCQCTLSSLCPGKCRVRVCVRHETLLIMGGVP